MKYTKIANKNYNLHILKTDKYKTIFMKVNFRRKLEKSEIAIRNLLVNVLFESTFKYPTKRLMEIETEELYELGYRGSNYTSGSYNVMNCDCVFLNPKYTEPSMLEESIAFLSEIILHPNIEENSFRKEGYDIGYHALEDYIVSMRENPDLYAQVRLLEEIELDTPLSYRSCGYIEDVENFDTKKLYDYYQTVLKEDLVDIFVIGEVDEEEIDSLVARYFPLQERKIYHPNHFYHSLQTHENVHFCQEKADLQQSKLLLGCQIIDASDFELRYVLNVYNYILGGSPNSKLFKNVREANSLCYSIGSSSQPLVSILTIRAGINAWEYDRACALILEQLEDIKKGKFEESEIENAITTYKNSLKTFEDSPESMISLYAGIEFLDSDTIEERNKKIEQVTKEKVIELSKKIKLDTIFFLEGSEQCEEKSS